MSKPVVFVSHISEEQKLASLLRDSIQEHFLGGVDVFVSSEMKSLPPGRKWLEEISSKLIVARLMIVICSPYSVGRPWVNFEAGAGWIKNIDIIPLCHSGMIPETLPLPLNMLQALKGADANELASMYRSVSEIAGLKVPNVDLVDLSTKIKRFEEWYGSEYDILMQLRRIREIWPSLIETLTDVEAPHEKYSCNDVPERWIDKIRPCFDHLKQRGHLAYSYAITTLSLGPGATEGNTGTLELRLSPALIRALREMD
jgi:hypothetical protein